MTDREQIAAFETELHNLVQRFIEEFDLPTASALGVLMLQIRKIENAAFDDSE